MRLKILFLLAAAYLLLGSGLAVVEVALWEADRQTIVAGIVAMAAFFFAFTSGELAMIDWMRRKNPDFVVSVLIGAKSLRLLATLFAITIYGFLGLPEFIEFTFNIFFFYIVTLVYASVLNIRRNK